MANSDRYRRDDRYGRDDRGFVDRATDEVRSWFGGDDADARRRHDRDADRGDVYRGQQGRPGPDRGREWVDRGPLEGARHGEGYGSTGWERGGDWGSARRESWPEDHGDTTPRHGMGPAGGWRDRHGPHEGPHQGGWHVGKGPKGYTRSDERIREDVCDRLTDDPYVDATNIEVAVQGGEVTLSGTVDRREDKRRAEDIAERISGVRDVNNRLRVGTTASGGLDTGTTTTAPRS